VAVATVAVDGDVSTDEIRRVAINLGTMPLFRKYDLNDLASTLNKVAGHIKRRGTGPVLDAVKGALAQEQLETAFFLAADLTLADGVIESEERKFLEELQKTLQVSEDTATKIVDVVVIKNR
jgi:tellurite resistance protein